MPKTPKDNQKRKNPGLHTHPHTSGGVSELDQAKFQHRMANEAKAQRLGNRKGKGLKRTPNKKRFDG